MLSSALCLSVALGSSIITGDILGPAEEFHVSEEVINLTVTLFVVGFGVGKLSQSVFKQLNIQAHQAPWYLPPCLKSLADIRCIALVWACISVSMVNILLATRSYSYCV